LTKKIVVFFGSKGKKSTSFVGKHGASASMVYYKSFVLPMSTHGADKINILQVVTDIGAVGGIEETLRLLCSELFSRSHKGSF